MIIDSWRSHQGLRTERILRVSNRNSAHGAHTFRQINAGCLTGNKSAAIPFPVSVARLSLRLTWQACVKLEGVQAGRYKLQVPPAVQRIVLRQQGRAVVILISQLAWGCFARDFEELIQCDPALQHTPWPVTPARLACKSGHAPPTTLPVEQFSCG